MLLDKTQDIKGLAVVLDVAEVMSEQCKLCLKREKQCSSHCEQTMLAVLQRIINNEVNAHD